MRKQLGALVKSFARDECGATFIENAILVALISAAIAGLVVSMNGSLETIINTISDHLTNAANHAN